eukprot:TRINITY_DN3204_c0_g1_i1.p1 TRINITY_DN3204_c0_g1~~TRINITY_DN3204_c0_g1_i1.p1  ORF type:complete len:272 (-),score=66.62 TRINITY_DN3204_c0_g1_i1:81-896(-)
MESLPRLSKHSVGRSITRKVKPLSKRELEDEKFSLNDECELKPQECAWTVTMRPPEGQGFKHLERVITVGPTGLRLLLPDTLEEVGKFPFPKLLEFSQNEALKIFQFTWIPTEKEEETYYFKTAKCGEIVNQIVEFIKEALRRKNVNNPEEVLESNIYHREPNLERMKMGGRQRTYSEDFTKTTRRPKESTAMPLTSPRQSKKSSATKSPSPTSPNSPRSPKVKTRKSVAVRTGTASPPLTKGTKKQKPKTPSSSSNTGEELQEASIEFLC